MTFVTHYSVHNDDEDEEDDHEDEEYVMAVLLVLNTAALESELAYWICCFRPRIPTEPKVQRLHWPTHRAKLDRVDSECCTV